MRILFLTETVPYPLDTGGRIKTFNTLRMLAGPHEVRLHAFIRDQAQRVHRGPLDALGVTTTLHLLARSVPGEAWFALRSLVGAPYSVGRHFDAAVYRQVAADAATWRPDLVYCDHLSMAEYARRLDVPFVYDAHNVEYAILQRFAATRPDPVTRAAAAIEWRRVRRYEAEVCRRSRLVFVVSDVDRQALAALAGAGGAFRRGADRRRCDPAPRRSTTLTREPRLLFLGGLHWPPNADALATFVRDIWPRVRAGRPDATLTSVGRDDHAAGRRVPGRAGRAPDRLGARHRPVRPGQPAAGRADARRQRHARQDPRRDGPRSAGGVHERRLRGHRGGPGHASAAWPIRPKRSPTRCSG